MGAVALPVNRSRAPVRFAAAARVVVVVLSTVLSVSLPLVAADALAQSGASAGVNDQRVDAPAHASDVLRLIQRAAHKLDYIGVFAYQQGELIESSQIAHVFDGKDEKERIEVLDGEPIEYLRANEDVRIVAPLQKIVTNELQRGDRFPGLLLSDASAIGANYDVRVVPEPYRVAGHVCQLIQIVPHDAHRYGYRLCADLATHLLLKAQTVGDDGSIVNQVAFTQVSIGGPVAENLLTSIWSTQGWPVIESMQQPVDLSGLGWRIAAPPGYISTLQVSRKFAHDKPVNQLVLSDGLATISIFIEPYLNDRSEYQPLGAARIGSVNVYGIKVANFWLTVLGEVPAGTLEQLARSIQFVQPAATK